MCLDTIYTIQVLGAICESDILFSMILDLH